MKRKQKSVAKIAAELADDPSVEERVERKIREDQNIFACDPSINHLSIAGIYKGKKIIHSVDLKARGDYEERAYELGRQVSSFFYDFAQRPIILIIEKPNTWLRRPAGYKSGSNAGSIFKLIAAIQSIYNAAEDSNIGAVMVKVQKWKANKRKLHKLIFDKYYPDWKDLATNGHLRDCVELLEWYLRRDKFQSLLEKEVEFKTD